MTPVEVIDAISKKYAPLSSECVQELLPKLKITNYAKGGTLVREGQYSDKAFYVLQGCARAYYLNDGRDVSDWFAFEEEFICSIVSFFANRPSPHFIEVLEDAVVLELSRKTVETLSDRFHDFERLIRVVVTNTMLDQQERLSSILFHTAEERYRHILTVRPVILNRVPLTHIASYLGITLETLSRIRGAMKRI
ncbi:MAG: Crp/Fnr family transcriptional regulator [Bacteroidota bacterium]